MTQLPSFRGIVIAGNKRGKKLGFPTANVSLTQKIPEGIYASTIQIEKKEYQAATFIGAAKTYDETDYKSETHILDFDEDIYGKEVVVTLLKKIRGNKKFESEEELIEQMEKDLKEIRTWNG